MSGLVVDLFAGGGGASTGIEAALGRPVDIAINHSATAIAVHRANHRGTTHYTSDVYEVDPIQATAGRPVALLWASPDCTHFSRAKGSRPDRPKSKKIRSLAWVVVRWARAVRPSVILLENVPEFLTWGPLGSDGQPVREKAGRTFVAWRAALRGLGYEVEHRVLDASRYGAPTRRKRLFVAARCDGQPIVWPEPTHGPGLLPYRTAGECIDWTIATRSIFGRKRPLAEKTLARIAEGIRRFVLDNPRPYLVPVKTWGGGGNGPRDSADPLPTVTASKRGTFAVVAPCMIETRNGEREGQRPRARSVEQPHGTVTADGSQGAVVAPVLVKFRHDSPGQSIGAPMPTITSGGSAGGRPAGAAHALAVAAPVLIAPILTKYHGGKPRVPALDEGMRTLDTSNRFALAEVGLIDMQRENAPRSLDEPLGVVTTQGNRFNSLRAAFVAKHFGGVVGQHPAEPIGTVTARDHHGPVAATLLKFRGTCNGASLDEPAPTITGQGLHLAECRAFLTKFYSCPRESGASLFDPSPTATGKARFGLVVVDGIEYEIGDIFLRMLEPEELLRAQFGEFANGYDLTAATTKEAKTRLIGNSVCPHVSRALVAANCGRAAEAVA